MNGSGQANATAVVNGSRQADAPAVVEFVHGGGAPQLHRGGGVEEEASQDLLGDRGNFGFPGNYGFKVGMAVQNTNRDNRRWGKKKKGKE